MEQFSILIKKIEKLWKEEKANIKTNWKKNIPKFQRGKKLKSFSKQLEKDE